MRYSRSGSRKGVYVHGYFRNGSWVEGYYRSGAVRAYLASDPALADGSFPELANNTVPKYTLKDHLRRQIRRSSARIISHIDAPGYADYSKNQTQQTSISVSLKKDSFILIALVVILVLCIISWIVT
jgi:hypothetical protein